MPHTVPVDSSTRTAARLFASPLGPLRLKASVHGVTSLGFNGEVRTASAPAEAIAHLDHLARELDRYFAGTLTTFTVPLDLQGTDFQMAVWRRLLQIPCGRTCSYGDLARAIGNPAAVRAVGLANGCNPVAIVVPCHRVIGSDGKLVGYGGELWRKEWLLKHEKFAGATDLFSAPQPSLQIRPPAGALPSPRSSS